MSFKTTLFCGMVLAVSAIAFAQDQSATQPAQPKTLAATIDVYVFPTEGQTAQQQSTDEAACYPTELDFPSPSFT